MPHRLRLHCILCRSLLQNGIPVENHSKCGKIKKNETILDEHSFAIFLLEEVLELPKEFCEDLLAKKGNPSQWMKCCYACTEIVKNLRKLFCQMSQMEKKFNLGKKKVRQTLEQSSGLIYVCDGNTMERVDSNEEIRNYLFSSERNNTSMRGRNKETETQCDVIFKTKVADQVVISNATPRAKGLFTYIDGRVIPTIMVGKTETKSESDDIFKTEKQKLFVYNETDRDPRKSFHCNLDDPKVPLVMTENTEAKNESKVPFKTEYKRKVFVSDLTKSFNYHLDGDEESDWEEENESEVPDPQITIGKDRKEPGSTRGEENASGFANVDPHRCICNDYEQELKFLRHLMHHDYEEETKDCNDGNCCLFGSGEEGRQRQRHTASHPLEESKCRCKKRNCHYCGTFLQRKSMKTLLQNGNSAVAQESDICHQMYVHSGTLNPHRREMHYKGLGSAPLEREDCFNISPQLNHVKHPMGKVHTS